jgi:hypothetical protein
MVASRSVSVVDDTMPPPSNTIGESSGRRSSKGRKLVRWDRKLNSPFPPPHFTDPDAATKDQCLLLAVEVIGMQTEAGFDWNAAGQLLEGQPSGEAIKQHLFKVRKARIENGLQVPPKFVRKSTATRQRSASVVETKTPGRGGIVKGRALLFPPQTPASAKPPKIVKKKANTTTRVIEDTPTKKSKFKKDVSPSMSSSGSSNASNNASKGRGKRADLKSNFELTTKYIEEFNNESQVSPYDTPLNTPQTSPQVGLRLRKKSAKNYSEILEDEQLESQKMDYPYEDEVDEDYQEDEELEDEEMATGGEYQHPEETSLGGKDTAYIANANNSAGLTSRVDSVTSMSNFGMNGGNFPGQDIKHGGNDFSSFNPGSAQVGSSGGNFSGQDFKYGGNDLSGSNPGSAQMGIGGGNFPGKDFELGGNDFSSFDPGSAQMGSGSYMDNQSPGSVSTASSHSTASGKFGLRIGDDDTQVGNQTSNFALNQADPFMGASMDAFDDGQGGVFGSRLGNFVADGHSNMYGGGQSNLLNMIPEGYSGNMQTSFGTMPSSSNFDIGQAMDTSAQSGSGVSGQQNNEMGVGNAFAFDPHPFDY